jgi:hypothetical protein
MVYLAKSIPPSNSDFRHPAETARSVAPSVGLKLSGTLVFVCLLPHIAANPAVAPVDAPQLLPLGGVAG